MSRRVVLWLVLGTFIVSSLAFGAPALADTEKAEPTILAVAWWWKQAQNEEIDVQGNKVAVDTPNPFCPGLPGGLGAVPGTCAPYRFPVEIVGGDYDEPNMLSGLGFDMSYLVPGSKVKSFKVELLEAEPGCYDDNGDGLIDPVGADHCEDTAPAGPIDDRKVRACLIPQIIADAEARPYVELPPYDCPQDAPTAKRKEIEAVDEGDTDGIDHVWIFDLTEYARSWAESFTAATNIMITGDPKSGTGSPDDTWQVVFAGPKAEKGIETKLVYEPGEFDFGSLPPSGGGVGSSTGGFSPSGAGTSFGSSTTSGFGATTGSSVDSTSSGASGSSAPSPAPSPGLELAGEDLRPLGTPWYVWLALLAGLIGFSLVRQVVIESTSGIRPNGVLARIHSMNAARRGEDVEAQSQGAAPLRGLADGLRKLRSKLPFVRGVR